MKLALLVLLVLVAPNALASPTANFTASKVQGTTCVAPCAVHFDAIGDGTTETTDPGFTRPFHSLYYSWDFGDPGSGTWSLGAAYEAGLNPSKNSDTGPIAGHVYTAAGIYTVTLTVMNPSLQWDTATEVVTVTDPNSHFTTANTYCFRSAATGNFLGCPLDTNADGTCDVSSGNCQTQSSASGAISAAGAGSGQRWILFRSGDSFSGGWSFAALNDNSGTPGLVQAFGSGAKPVIGGGINLDDNWTVTGLQINGDVAAATGSLNVAPTGTCPNGPCTQTSTIDNATFYANDVDNTGGACWNMGYFGDAYRQPVLRAIIGTTCEHGGHQFLSGHRVLFMGNSNDRGGRNTSNGAYSFRGEGFQHSVFAHNYFTNPATGGQTMQLRSDEERDWSQEIVPEADAEANEWNLYADNYDEIVANQGGYVIRLCPDSGCNCTEASTNSCTTSGCGDSGTGETVRLRNWIFERNMFKALAGTAASKNAIFDIWGGEHSIRNNVVKYDSSVPAANDINFATVGGNSVGAQTASGGTCTGDAEVANDYDIFNNTVYITTASYAGTYSFCTDRGVNGGCTSGCRCYNNLLVTTSSGGASLSNDASWSNDNHFVTSDVFDGAMPSQGSGDAADFVPSALSAPLGAGRDFNTGTDTSFWNFDDALGLCRPGGGDGWDDGAVERGGLICSTLFDALIPPIQFRGSGGGGIKLP